MYDPRLLLDAVGSVVPAACLETTAALREVQDDLRVERVDAADTE